jgi:quinol monooxygenase YgiN
MIKHVVMANFKAEIGQRERDEFAKKVKETLAKVPGVRNVIIGQALKGASKPRYDGALFVDFDNEAALKGYLEHPVHKAVAAQMPAMFSESFISNYLY